MPAHKDEIIQRWWPTTQTLDLVQGDTAQVAAAVQAECTRFWSGEPIRAEWKRFSGLNDALLWPQAFANVPTHILALPTRSNWTVLWNNSFLCDGYDSLCWCLTVHHGLTTLHWSAHDTTTTFQANAMFHHRRMDQGELVERNVQCAENDGKWAFLQSGDPLPQENTSAYQAKRKRDRLNEAEVVALLDRLGAQPWSEAFYAVAEKPTFVLQRLTVPKAATIRSRENVIGAGKVV